MRRQRGVTLRRGAPARGAMRGAVLAAVMATVAVVGPAACAAARGPAAGPRAPMRGPGTGNPDSNSMNVLSADDYNRQAVGRVEELFDRIPGVRVGYRTDGQLSITIRGAHGILFEGEPLVVLDGIPLAAGVSALASIPPRDVARVEVLKDPVDLAAWGSRSGNGVIVITTKRPPRPSQE